MRVKDALGRFGEDVAARYLTAAGLVILERNWRCSAGELDIIAADGPTLVFCEVKTRSSTLFGSPAESVTPVKAGRIRHLALRWLLDQPGVIAIPKAQQESSQRSNLEALKIKLDDEDRAEIAALPKDQRYVKPPFAPDWNA